MLKNKVRELEESRKRTTTEAVDTQRIQDLERTHVRDVNNLTSQLRQYQLCDKESKEKAKASALKVWAGLLCFFIVMIYRASDRGAGEGREGRPDAAGEQPGGKREA